MMSPIFLSTERSLGSKTIILFLAFPVDIWDELKNLLLFSVFKLQKYKPCTFQKLFALSLENYFTSCLWTKFCISARSPWLPEIVPSVRKQVQYYFADLARIIGVVYTSLIRNIFWPKMVLVKKQWLVYHQNLAHVKGECVISWYWSPPPPPAVAYFYWIIRWFVTPLVDQIRNEVLNGIPGHEVVHLKLPLGAIVYFWGKQNYTSPPHAVRSEEEANLHPSVQLQNP